MSLDSTSNMPNQNFGVWEPIMCILPRSLADSKPQSSVKVDKLCSRETFHWDRVNRKRLDLGIRDKDLSHDSSAKGIYRKEGDLTRPRKIRGTFTEEVIFEFDLEEWVGIFLLEKKRMVERKNVLVCVTKSVCQTRKSERQDFWCSIHPLQRPCEMLALDRVASPSMVRFSGAYMEKGSIRGWVCKGNLYQLTRSHNSQVIMNLGLILCAPVHKCQLTAYRMLQSAVKGCE